MCTSNIIEILYNEYWCNIVRQLSIEYKASLQYSQVHKNVCSYKYAVTLTFDIRAYSCK